MKYENYFIYLSYLIYKKLVFIKKIKLIYYKISKCKITINKNSCY